MPHHSVDQKVEQALTELEARRRMNRLGIESPFMRCPEPGCDHGWIEYVDLENACRRYSLCSLCEGTGQVLIEPPAPDFVVRFRDWWQRNREPVTWGLKFASWCVMGAIFLYLWSWLRAIAGLLEWKP